MLSYREKTILKNAGYILGKLSNELGQLKEIAYTLINSINDDTSEEIKETSIAFLSLLNLPEDELLRIFRKDRRKL